MNAPLVLVSHALRPYVQRAAIVLAEKGLAFERRDIDLAHKPDWFLTVSPLGKTPVLLVDRAAILESAATCEYLEDTALPRLHPQDAVRRAQHRAWMEFASSLLNPIGAFYKASDAAALEASSADIRARFVQIEGALGDGAYFDGDAFRIGRRGLRTGVPLLRHLRPDRRFRVLAQPPEGAALARFARRPSIGAGSGVVGVRGPSAGLPARPRIRPVAAHAGRG